MNDEAAKTEAHSWLASNQSLWTKQLIELANVSSGSTNLQGLEEVADMLCAWSGVPAVTAQRVPLPPRRTVADDGSEHSVETGVALKWEMRPQAAKRVLLGIHYDTVYSPVHVPSKCQHVNDERLVGPGVADAKGGIVVVRAALQALEQFHLAPDCGWTLLFTPDEEIGSPSSGHLWTNLAATHDFGLLFEPAMASGALVGERKGSGSYVFVVRGKAAHAGRDFTAGRNAVALGSHLSTQLDRLNGKRHGLTVNIGHFVGGGPVNVVPNLATLRFNVRVPDAESQSWFEAALSDILDEADRQEGFTVSLSGGFTAPPKPLTHTQRELMTAIEHASATLGHRVHWQASGGVCDGNRLAAAGLPNIDTLGPVGDLLHSPEEWVDPSTIPYKAQMVVELIHNFSLGKFTLESRTGRQQQALDAE
jgi:glutamate carboxypeptidase